MMRRAAFVLLFCSVSLFAAAPKFDAEVVTTERAPAPSGAIRIEDSSGELNIEGWDEPDVQLVVTRSHYVADTQPERDRATKELNGLRIALEKQGNDLVIRTPHHSRFGHYPLLDYRIMVPRTARLVIRHGTGDVVIGGVSGAIDAGIKVGDILLRLDAGPAYAFDVDCREGRIQSDFAGAFHRRHLWAERFTESAPPPAIPIRLRAGIGGINIQKIPAR